MLKGSTKNKNIRCEEEYYQDVVASSVDEIIKLKLAKRIKYLREKKGYSLEYLANLCEINRTYLPSIERSERDVSLKMLEKIAKGLDITLYELFDFDAK